MPRIPQLETGVYEIRNTVNGKVYGGSATKTFKSRWASHRNDLRKGVHVNPYLQRAWDKHGEDAFIFSVVERCEPTQCIEREQHYLDTVRPWDPKIGYNICRVAGSCLGTKKSPEAKAKMSAAKKGKPSGRKGIRLSDETKAKISRAQKGRVGSRLGNTVTEATKQRLRQANLGKQHTEETKQLLSEKHWSHQENAEQVRAIIAGKSQGRKHTEEAKQKVSEAHRGRVHTEEAVANMKAAHWSKRPDAAEIDARRRETRRRKQQERLATVEQLVSRPIPKRVTFG